MLLVNAQQRVRWWGQSQWRSNILHYQRVRYPEIYPGIDVEY